jgi:hypothetical protein
MYRGRYLKAFETQDYVPVAIQNGSLVYSPNQTNPWGLYGLPINGLSDVSNWGSPEVAYTKHAAIQDNTNSCLWIINTESSSTYLFETAYMSTTRPSSALNADINRMLNTGYQVIKVPFNKVFRSADQTLWFSRYENNTGSMGIQDKVFKQYQPTINRNGIEVIDTSQPPRPYLFRRTAVINYNNSKIELPLGIRFQSIGIYNENFLSNTRYRDDYYYNNKPILPTIEDLQFIIKNELLNM